MHDWREDVWFWDTEVFRNRWLLNALSIHGDRVSFSNDAEGLANWLNHTNPLLFGFNCKHYDNYILKAILAGSSPEEVRAISDSIVKDGVQGWEIQMGWVRLPATVDLMLDLPTRPSLKLIEGNMRMSIEESSVSFDAESVSDAEWEEVVEYCWHDVEALVPLYKARKEYLEAKETLALMMKPRMDVRAALNMTNAKLSARFLGARGIPHDDERDYKYPSNLKKELIPKEVIEFFDRLSDYSIPLNMMIKTKGEDDDEEEAVL